MTVRKILPLVFLATVLASLPSAAGAAYRVGIGDQRGAMFDHPKFQALGLKRVRYIVPWDVFKHPGQLAEVDGFMNRARTDRKEVFVTFTATRGCWKNNRYSRRRACRAPSARAYRSQFRRFRKRFAWVRVYAPWNEANHQSQPTARSPRRAATYYNVVRANCRGCTIVAADVLDQSGVDRYLRAFRRYAKGSPRRWGLHNYSDVNRLRSTGTRRVLRTVPGEVWLTETGGIVKFQSFGYSESRAAHRTRYMFKLADRYTKRRRGMRSRITRVYLYQWTGAPRGTRFDAGLTNPDGSVRKAYATFRSYVKKRRK